MRTEPNLAIRDSSSMDFLKSAVASAIAGGPPFPYSFGDKVDIDESIWTLSNGTKRVGKPLLSVVHQQPR